MRLAYLTFFVLSAAALGSADILKELRDFQDLLPKIRIPFIIGKHYLFDGNFRTGYKYLRSSNFQKLLLQDFARSPEIQDIADYLGYSINLYALHENVRSISIPIGSPDEFARERTFSSFIDEVVDYLPNDKFKNLIRQKVNSNSEFAELYAKVMDPQFRRLVNRARYSNSLAGAIRTLKNNNVDVDHLLRVVFQLLDKWAL